MSARQPPLWMRTARGLGLDRLASRLAAGRPVIVMYHGVADDPLPHRKFFPSRLFAEHVEALARRFDVVPMARVVSWLETGEPLPRRPAVVTFDDAYANLLEFALPELARRGMPATVYATSVGLEDPDALLWFDEIEASFLELADPPPRVELDGRTFILPDGVRGGAAGQSIARSLKRLTHAERMRVVAAVRAEFPSGPAARSRYRLLDREGIRRVAAMGFEVGGHTAGHVILSREAPAEQRREIVSNRDALRDATGIEPRTFAYPNGRDEDVTPDTLRFAREAGYRAAVTTEAGCASRDGDRMALPRVSANYLGAYGTGDALALLPLRIQVSAWLGS